MRESVETIIAHGARPAGVLIALDRMERGTGALSAVQALPFPAPPRTDGAALTAEKLLSMM